MYTRREFAQLALAAVALPGAVRAQRGAMFNGVRLGVQTYSFRALPRSPGGDAVDTVIAAMGECGLVECELFAAQVEPQGQTREQVRKWRLETPIEHFRAVADKFRRAGIAVYAYNYSPNPSFSDDEINRGFEMARALGAEIITASTQLDTAKRIVPFAAQHEMVVAMHGHSNVSNPNEFATPASFAAALKMSRYFKVNLDIGHFTAANFDALAYLHEHHADITNLHLKDRKKNQGENLPWGQGDTPIRDVLRLLQEQKWPIRAYIEYEYRGERGPVEEVKKCLDYAKQALA